MEQLTTSLLGQACRIFLTMAYPEGPATIPEKKRVYYELPQDQPVAAFLPPAPCAMTICQDLRNELGGIDGYALRLGSSGFAHLKLRVQKVTQNNQATLVFMVDTHDAFSKDNRLPPPDHPEAKQWMLLQGTNRTLKEKIEAAFEKSGLTTLNSILRGKL